MGAWPRCIAAACGVAVLGILCGGCRDGGSTQPRAADSPAPVLPATSYAYSDLSVPLPPHFVVATVGSVLGADNMPATNRTTDAGATLGRVLFYDRRLSANDAVACASCHQQAFGFGDTARFSVGLHGGHTRRHAMGLANARFYQTGRFFWDERAASLEAQVLQPIQDAVEMGMNLDDLVVKLRTTTFYPPLFQAAFGTSDVTSDRISRALAQFVRSLVSAQAKFDEVFANNPVLNFAVLTAPQQQGQQLFNSLGCAACHRTNAHFGDTPRNTGLDATVTDSGAGGGRFKPPSLRNIAVRPPYMHDGRFRTLREVVEFYDSGVQPNPLLDPRLRANDGTPRRLQLTQAQRDALVAFMEALTDQTFLTAARYSSPFVAK